MKQVVFIIALLFITANGFAQHEMPSALTDYEELVDTKPHDSKETWNNKMSAPVQLSWGSTDIRYNKFNIPDIKKKALLSLTAWKGERIHAQAVLWTNRNLDNVTVSVSDLRNGASVIPASDISTHFVRYVMTDELNKDGNGGCGHRENKAEWDSLLVADVLDIINVRDISACHTQPIWIKIHVPSNVNSGKYKGVMTVSGANFKPMKLHLEVNVLKRTLPNPKNWALHLDLWQNPYAVARYYQVPLWSQEHFDLLYPIMKMLADVGQRAITASIMHKPWNGQTEDHFDSMITRIKRIDGSWSYDYAVFDKWVTFMMDKVGIDEMINCYTMIPWSLRFDYYDEATNRMQFVEAEPGDSAYTEYWETFLKDFSQHLRHKGWFEKTAISMDERPMEDMREAIKVIKNADPDFKISLAGGYHPEILSDLYYLSIPYGQRYPEDVITKRRENGQISCVYTCCSEAFPNIFTFSDPAEAAWTVLHAVAGGYDGYSRWSINAWTADPLRDSRFRLFAAGDTYSIYPGPRSSIRFERLMEGLQNCEKINMLKKEFTSKNETKKLEKLNKALTKFTPEGHCKNQQSTAEAVSEINDLLNSL
ncbi:glycoside hydrolase domain-containing protein [Phocaeicola faecalis]|mgnify:FL=1